MRYRKLSPTGDYVFGNNLNDFYIDTPAAPAQAVKTRLKLWLGEWFLDSDAGTPYLAGVLGKFLKPTADTTIRDRVLETLGVMDISSFESTVDPTTRAYTATIAIDTQYGQAILTSFYNAQASNTAFTGFLETESSSFLTTESGGVLLG